MNGPILPQSTLSDLPGLLPNRACRPCVSIKAKCIPLPGSEDKTCERCHRLGKNCTTPQPKIRKRPTGRATSRDRSSLPEHGNGNGIASLPAPQLHQRALLEPIGSLSSLYTSGSTAYPITTIPTPPVSTTEHHGSAAETSTCPATRPYTSNVPDISNKSRAQPLYSSAFEISPEIGHSFIYPAHENLFKYFRDQMSAHFPFITLTKDTDGMRQDRPFTYVACVAAAAHSDPTFQHRILRDMLKYLGDHMLLRGEKSLDLLQGLLIMVNWYHVYRNGNPQLMNLVHLAKSLVVDLGLNRRGGTASFQVFPSENANRMLHGQPQDSVSNQHSLEERRACLGAYHVQAKLATCYRRLDTVPWSEHIDDCCQVLNDTVERASDLYAVALVRLDHLVDRYRNIDGGQQKLAIPLQQYVKLFSADIDNFKQSLPFHLQNDTNLKLHIQSSQVCLFERIINSDCDISSHKVEALHACLAGVVGYFNSFMSQKLENFHCLAFLSWSTIAHAFDIYAKLSFIEIENWDLEYVRHNPGFIATTDAMMETMKKAQMVEDIRNPKAKSTRFDMTLKRLGMFKQWYSSRVDSDAKSRGERQGADVEPSTGVNDSNNGLYYSDISELVFQDFTTDWSWLDNIFNSSSWPQQSAW